MSALESQQFDHLTISEGLSDSTQSKIEEQSPSVPNMATQAVQTEAPSAPPETPHQKEIHDFDKPWHTPQSGADLEAQVERAELHLYVYHRAMHILATKTAKKMRAQRHESTQLSHELRRLKRKLGYNESEDEKDQDQDQDKTPSHATKKQKITKSAEPQTRYLTRSAAKGPKKMA
ncbi:hypothetical protein ACHAPJ_008279 [Fusarium lateritium]